MNINAVAMIAAASLMALGVTSAAVAADGAELYKAKACGTCHGVDAKTPLQPMYPKLAGQSALYTLQQLKDIKEGKRNNGQTVVMKGIVAAVSEDEMKAIAEWLSTL